MMKNKIPCEMIQDLLPSYIDELTSEVTNEQIKEHLSECENCRKVLHSMKDPDAEPIRDENREEIDFLKKTRKKMKNIVLGSVAAAVVIMAIVLFTRIYFVGSNMNSEFVVCKMDIDGRQLTLSGTTTDENLAIQSVAITEADGVVNIAFKGVKRSILYDGLFEQEYLSEQDIKEVWLGDRLVWSQGENISAVTAAVYNTRHPYIGEMSLNMSTADALNMADYLGAFTNELLTEQQPYVWKICFEKPFSTERKLWIENTLKSYAYALLAVIENLDEVSYEYVMDGVRCESIVTRQEASDFAGEDIKVVGEEINTLQNLMEKAGLTDMSYVRMAVNRHTEDDSIQVRLTNMSDSDLSSIRVEQYMDGKLCGTQEVQNADGTMIKKGQSFDFTFIPAELGPESWWMKEVVLKFTVCDIGKESVIEEPVNIVADVVDNEYEFYLSGDPEKGYEIMKK